MGIPVHALLLIIAALVAIVVILARHIAQTRRSLTHPRDTTRRPITHPLDDSQYPHWWD